MNRAVSKGRSLTPEVRYRGFIYTTFGLGASHAGLWAYGLGLDKKPAWPARRAGLDCPGPCITGCISLPARIVLQRMLIQPLNKGLEGSGSSADEDGGEFRQEEVSDQRDVRYSPNAN
jgi:hypothetical protein